MNVLLYLYPHASSLSMTHSDIPILLCTPHNKYRHIFQCNSNQNAITSTPELIVSKMNTETWKLACTCLPNQLSNFKTSSKGNCELTIPLISISTNQNISTSYTSILVSEHSSFWILRCCSTNVLINFWEQLIMCYVLKDLIIPSTCFVK